MTKIFWAGFSVALPYYANGRLMLISYSQDILSAQRQHFNVVLIVFSFYIDRRNLVQYGVRWSEPLLFEKMTCCE